MAGLSPMRRCLAPLLINRRMRMHRCNDISCRSFASFVNDRPVRTWRQRARHVDNDRAQRSSVRQEYIEDDEQSTRNTRSASSTRSGHRSTHSSRSHTAARGNWSAYRQPIGEFVYGFHPVIAALQANKREVHKVYLQAEKDTADGFSTVSSSSALHREREKQQLHDAIQRHSPPLSVEYISRQQLNLLSDNRPHNGVVIDAAPLQPPLSDTLPTPAPPDSHSAVAPHLWLLLDEVQDPQNLGAILRSAAFFGATGVVLCKKNCAPLSPVASKASSGCLETIDVRWCRSSTRVIDEAKRAGWRVVGLSAEEVSDTKRVRDCRELEVSGPTVLVVGNEGRGLRTLVRQSCDELLSIRGGEGVNGAGEVAGLALLDSLNVSTAVAIALYQCTSKRPSATQIR